MQLYHDIFEATECSNEEASDIVLLHGWGMNSLVWDEIIPELLMKHRVTIIDLPGLGRSPVPAGDYDLDYLTQHVVSVAPEKAIWMGWSLGGLIAMNLAIKHPERVSALIAVASTPSFIARNDEAGEWLYAMPEKIMNGFIDIFSEDAEGTLIRFLALQCKGSPSIRQDIRTLKEMVYFYGLPAPQALREGLKILRDADLRKEVKNILCPSFFVLGRHDNLVPVGLSIDIQKVMPDAEIAIIEEASHVPMISSPETFSSAVKDYLNKL